MKKETIKVTINPDGSCTEVNRKGVKPKNMIDPDLMFDLDASELADYAYEYEQNSIKTRRWREAEATLRTFEIEREPCTCVKDGHKCKKWCTINTPVIFLSEPHTAEILPNNKVKIIS